MRGLSTLLLTLLQYLTITNDCWSINAVTASEHSGQSLNFLLLGDWGKGGNTGYISSNLGNAVGANITEDDDKSKLSRNLKNNEATNQAAVAKAMGNYAEKNQPSFVVALGDNFYTNGVSSTTDVYWDYLWTNVYLDSYAALRVPWYAVLGNHDYGYGSKGIQAQIDRTLIDNYWVMPATNYSKTFHIPSGGTVSIIFVDTTTLAPSVNKCCNENGGISTEVQAQRIENQLRHIDAMLAEAVKGNPTWLLVAGHYPVFSTGEHGDTSELKNYLVPLLQKYRVHAYFCGHDHFSDHLKYDGTHYFVNGGGSMTDSVGASSSAQAIWAGEGYSAFAAASATLNELTISYIDSDGAVRYTYTMDNPREEGPSMRPSEAVAVKRPGPAQAVEVSSKIVIISSGFAALAFLMIAGGFYYESKGRKKKKKTKKGVSRFMSYTLPGAGFTTKPTKKISKSKNSLRALASTRSPRKMEEAMMDLVGSKSHFGAGDGNDEDADHTLMHGTQSQSQSNMIVLGTNTSREGGSAFATPSSKRYKGDSKGQHNGHHGHGHGHGNNNGDGMGGEGMGRRSANTSPDWDEEAANPNTKSQAPHTIISHLTSSTPMGVQRSKDGRIFEAIPDVANERHKRARTSIF